MQTTNVTIRLRQSGHLLSAFRGCRFVGTATFTGTIAVVSCFDSVKIGDAGDPRRGRILTPEYMRGPFTVELIDDAGAVVSRICVGTAADVAKHPTGDPSLVA